MKWCIKMTVWALIGWGSALGATRGFAQGPDFEARAIARAQQASLNQLDPALPPRPFGKWFAQLVGVNAGVTWQVTDCGEQPARGQDVARDLPSCVEVSAILPNDRMVIVSMLVGSFKLGIGGRLATRMVAVEDFGDLVEIKRLSELPVALRRPPRRARRTGSALPATRQTRLLIVRPSIGNGPAGKLPPRATVADLPPTPPAPDQRGDGRQRISEGVLQGNAINKVMPAYPAVARQINAVGEVQVQITITEDGRVSEAVAITGHPLLRAAAEDAARRWTFKPTTLNGKPIKAQGVLTFLFTRNN